MIFSDQGHNSQLERQYNSDYYKKDYSDKMGFQQNDQIQVAQKPKEYQVLELEQFHGDIDDCKINHATFTQQQSLIAQVYGILSAECVVMLLACLIAQQNPAIHTVLVSENKQEMSTIAKICVCVVILVKGICLCVLTMHIKIPQFLQAICVAIVTVGLIIVFASIYIAYDVRTQQGAQFTLLLGIIVIIFIVMLLTVNATLFTYSTILMNEFSFCSIPYIYLEPFVANLLVVAAVFELLVQLLPNFMVEVLIFSIVGMVYAILVILLIDTIIDGSHPDLTIGDSMVLSVVLDMNLLVLLCQYQYRYRKWFH